jgi:hypothetical protein
MRGAAAHRPAMKTRIPSTEQQFFQLNGGIDLVTPPISIKPGYCTDAVNYEIGLQGGYRRIDGYERLDGRAKPSDAKYYVIPATISATISNGDVVTGTVSGAVGTAIATTANSVVVTKVTGAFGATDILQVSGVTKAQATAVMIQDGAETNQLHWQYKNLAGDVYRALIQAVPGDGAIRGVWFYNDVVYAFRNNVGQSECQMYKSSGSGWVLVSTPTLQPTGRYSFTNYNFGSGLRMYGCDGKNKAFQFDGTTFTQITTGMANDKPIHIAAHRNHLFLAFDNSLQHSAIGNPLSYSVVLGAGELNIGETITNLVPQPGDAQGAAMAVYSRNGTFVLYGNSSADWKLVTLQSTTGAYPWTAQYQGTTFVLDDRGVTNLAAVQEYGNFSASTISQLVRPYLIENASRVVASLVSKDKNQYRLIFNNGRAMYYTLQSGFMPVLYAHVMSCAFSGEATDGTELLLCGGDNGYVYQMDIGTSFDGDDITSAVDLAFNHFGSPRILKYFRSFVLEVQGSGYADFVVSADLGYGSAIVEAIPMSQMLISGRWDAGFWDTGVWDGKSLAPTSHELGGTAENIAIHFGQVTDYQPPITYFSCVVAFSNRRQMR